MSTSIEKISIGNIDIDVVRKDIKNMHLAVYPPKGRVRLAAPINTNNEVARLFAISKLGWIKKNVKNFNDQPRESIREYTSGESHYFNGKRYLLKVIENSTVNKIDITGFKHITMWVKPNSTVEDKANLLKEWYRKQLKDHIPELLEKWESTIGVKTNHWGVRNMRTKWGSCNTDAKRIWVNLELAKKPTECLEYIIVHELVHLLERNHNTRFVKYLDEFMPKWRLFRDELNNTPFRHLEWGY